MRPQLPAIRLGSGVIAILAMALTLVPAAEATNGYFTDGYAPSQKVWPEPV